MTEAQELDLKCINTIRTLSMDAVQAANSGHPGTPMALAPVAYCLWQRVLRFDPEDPIWPNRDRFVLSVGHASMLLYAILHLSGVKAVNKKYERLGELSVTLDDIRRFSLENGPDGAKIHDHAVLGIPGKAGAPDGVNRRAVELPALRSRGRDDHRVLDRAAKLLEEPGLLFQVGKNLEPLGVAHLFPQFLGTISQVPGSGVFRFIDSVAESHYPSAAVQDFSGVFLSVFRVPDFLGHLHYFFSRPTVPWTLEDSYSGNHCRMKV